MVTASWKFFLVGDTPSRDELVALAHAGAPVCLVRAAPGTSVEQTLTPDGDWRDTDRLARIKYRGDIAWAVDISADQAREIAGHWRDVGRVAPEADLDERLPDDLAVEAARADDIGARRDRLRSDHLLDAAAMRRAREVLLDDAGELASGWLTGKVAVAVERAFRLLDAEDIVRRHDAFAAAGQQVVWAIISAPDDVSRAMKRPDGVSCPNEPNWLRALGSMYFGQGSVLLTGPSLDSALLDTDDRGVVAGSREFVETVLGTAPPVGSVSQP